MQSGFYALCGGVDVHFGIEPFSNFVFFDLQIMVGLKIEPKLGGIHARQTIRLCPG
jgi:hypothetical protein